MRLVKQATGEVVAGEVSVADGFWSRFRGRQWHPPLPQGHGLLLVPCSAVHTFWVRGSLDIVLLDRKGQVVAVRASVPPWRVVPSARGAYATLELAGGSSCLQVGDLLRLQDDGPVPASAAFLTDKAATSDELPKDAPIPWTKLALLTVLVLLAYANSFGGAFVFDDFRNFAGNPDVQQGCPTWKALAHGRPLVTLSLAWNYSLFGRRPAGYHFFNLIVHLSATYLLFGIARRSLIRGPAPPYAPEEAAWLALAIAALWAVHPLQTEAVTYVFQRCESLMGLFFLFALYAVIRGAEESQPRLWYGLAVASCLLGMFTKEVMAVAPIVILLYDRIYLAGSWRELLRRRWGLHAALFVSLAAILVPLATYARPFDDGLSRPLQSSLTYLLTEAAAIFHYLRQTLWPTSPCFDYYDWPAARVPADWVVPGLGILALLALAGWALWRHPRLGFLGITFFLILGPTSSILPLDDVVVEHRMYLPLAPLIALLVLGADAVSRRLFARMPGARPAVFGAIVAAIVLMLLVLTARRNEDYASAARLWGDVIAKRPNNFRAYGALADIEMDQGRFEESLRLYQQAAERAAACGKPNTIASCNNHACTLMRVGRLDEAIAMYRAAPAPSAAESPEVAVAAITGNLGLALWLKGDTANAADCFRLNVQRNPEEAFRSFPLALMLHESGKEQEAQAARAEGLRRLPSWPETARKEAWTLATDPQPGVRYGDLAVFIARQARFAADADSAELLDTLAAAYAEAGRFPEALAAAEKAKHLADASNAELAAAIEKRLQVYRRGLPYRDAR